MKENKAEFITTLGGKQRWIVLEDTTVGVKGMKPYPVYFVRCVVCGWKTTLGKELEDEAMQCPFCEYVTQSAIVDYKKQWGKKSLFKRIFNRFR